MISLAVKYRPTTFNDVVAQENIKAILEQQIVTKNHKNLLAVLAQVKQPVLAFLPMN